VRDGILSEVFVEHGLEVEMEVRALAITGMLSLDPRSGAQVAPRVLGVLRYQVSRAPMP
jgi:hypothetical protein